MLLKVYDQYKNTVGYIRKYTDLEIVSELETGDKTLSFTYQNKDLRVSDAKSGLKRSAVLGSMVLGMAVLGSDGEGEEEELTYIQNEYYIETPDDLYVIKEIDIDSNDYPEITCQLDLEELEADMVESFSAENMPIQDVANLALVGTGWRADTEGIDPEKLRSVATLKATPYTILGKIRDAWMCEMRFDTKNQIVYFRDEFGDDKGVFFSKMLNLRRLKLTDDSYEFYTRIVPIGEDDLRIDDVNDGKGYVENYQYSSKIRTLIWEDTSYTDAEALKEDAEAKLDDLSKPSRSYSANVVDLAKQKQEYSIMDFSLGDTITLMDQESGIKDKQRIVKLKEYPDDPYKNSCELSNTTWTWEELQAKIQAAADAFEDISNSDGSVNGYYVHGLTSDGVLVLEKTVNPDGSTSTEVVGTLTDNLTTINSSVQDAYESLLSVAGDVITISGELDVVYERVGTLEATSLTATEADLKYATIGSLEATTADITNLYAIYGDIQSLVVEELAAVTANIDQLTANIADITSLLAGEAGVGLLEAIHLTTANAVIDEAVIVEALVGTVLADIIQSNVIYTDYITIMSLDGNYINTGSMEQFSDSNGTVRIQIGLDASGNYNFYIADEDGNLLWDALGLTEAGLTANGAIIKDAAIADDANIAASKLDIADLTETLNENGQLVLTAEQITIGGGTLDYALTEITQQIYDLESEGIESIVNYYALSTNPDWYPPHDAASSETSILGSMVLGEAVLGLSGDEWTTERLVASDGEYLWYAQLVTYIDGSTVWTTPTLITDDYIRTITTITQTELEVVQGQIQAKIWEDDIEYAVNSLGDEISIITDQYSQVTVLIDTIDLRVGELTTTVDAYYTELDSRLAAITIDLDGITMEVRDVAERSANAITEGTPYYAVSTSADWYPPFEGETGQMAILGEMVLGEAMLGFSGAEWTTDQPESAEDEYIWLSYLRERVDGSTYWTEPTLLTDEWARLAEKTQTERYAQIVVEVDSITEEVVNVRNTLTSEYSTTAETRAAIEMAVEDSEASILIIVSDLETTVTEELTTVSDRMSEINADLNGVTARVQDVETTTSNALVEGIPYYALSTNPDWYPPFEADGDTAVLGSMKLGSALLGFSGDDWSVVQPKYQESEYVWMAYLRERLSGSSYWTEPTLLTDEYLRQVTTEISTQYSQLVLEVDSALLEVYSLQETLANGYSTTTEMHAYIEESIEEDHASIMQEVSGRYVSNDEISGYYTIEEANAAIESYVDDSSASILEEVSFVKETLEGEITASTASIQEYVDKSMSQITFQVDGALGGKAVFTMIAGDNETMQEIDLSQIREVFADEDSEVLIGAGKITFGGGTLVIDMENFSLTEDGTLSAKNCVLDGTLSNTNGLLRAVLTGGGLSLYYDDIYYGRFYSTYWMSDPEKRGIFMGLRPDAAFMSFSMYNSDTGMNDASYIINYDLDTYGDFRHLFYGRMKLYNSLYLESSLYFGDDGLYIHTGTEYGTSNTFGSLDGGNWYTGSGCGFGVGNVAIGDYMFRVSGSAIASSGWYVNDNCRLASWSGDGGSSMDIGIARVNGKTGTGGNFYIQGGASVGNVDLNGYKFLVDGDSVFYGGADYYGILYLNNYRMYVNDSCYMVSWGEGSKYDIALGFGGGNIYTDDNSAVSIGNGTISGGYMLEVYGTAWINGTVYGSSDESLKNSIKPLSADADTFLDKIEPIQFRFNNDEEKKIHYGVTYQNVKEALEAEGIDPDDSAMVGMAKDKDGSDIGTVAYDELIAPLIYEVKKLKAEVEALKKGVA